MLEFAFCVTLLLSFLLAILFVYERLHRWPSRPRLPPGPIALPIIGHLHLLGLKIHHSLHELSVRNGPLFHLRLGSALCVVASTPQFGQEFFKAHELTFSSRPISTVIKTISYDVSFAFAPYGDYWKSIKKLCMHELLSTRTIQHFECAGSIEVRRFLTLLMDKQKSGKPVSLTKEIFNLTNNIISQMMLSVRCSDIENEATMIRDVIRDVTQIFGEFDVSDTIGICKKLDLQGIKRRAKDIHKRYDALLEKIMNHKEKIRRTRKVQAQDGEGSQNKSKDFLEMLMDTMENETFEVKLTRDHVKSLILDFFTAGTDTTAVALDWALAELINNPRVLKKAQHEIDTVIGHQRLLQESDASNLPYIQAIIKETLRLHPPIPLITRTAVKNCSTTAPNDYTIPANTMLLVNIWSIGRNPEYWEDPLQFKPERFLYSSSSKSIDVKGHDFELLPFGTGRRGCLGMVLALKELHFIFATLVQMFGFRVLPKSLDGNGAVDMTEKAGFVVPRVKDLVCLLEARNNLSIINE